MNSIYPIIPPTSRIAAIIVMVTLCTYPCLAQSGDNISFVGSWPAGPCFAGSGADRLVCYGEGAFLVTADVTDPTAHIELGRLQMPYILTHVTMHDDLAFVELDDSSWRVIDLIIPSEPMQIGSMQLPGELYDVVFVGNLAYLGTSTGLHIVDITNLAAPTIIGTWNDYPSVQHLEVRGDFAYLAAYTGDFQVVNISNPKQPFTVYSDEFLGYGWDIVLVGNYAYVAKGRLLIYDISDPTSPTLIDDRYFSSSLTRIAHEGKLLVGTSSSSNLLTIDTRMPDYPVELCSLDIDGSLNHLVLDDGILYAKHIEGLHIVDVSTPDTPFLAGVCDVASPATDVAVAGNYCYLVAGRTDLHVLNVSEPSDPMHLGRIDLPGEPTLIVIREDLAYVSSPGVGLLILNLANPENPELVGTITIPENPTNICFKGNILFIPGGHEGVYIYDITDPLLPEPLGHFDTYDAANDVSVFNNLASVADSGGGIRVFDVSDLANPVALGYYVYPLYGWAVEVVPGIAWLGCGGLVGIDISNPNDPTPIVYSDFSGLVRDLILRDGLAYLTNRFMVRVVDIRHPPFMGQVASFEALRRPNGLDLAGNLIYLATGDMGLTIVRHQMVAPVVEGAQPTLRNGVTDLYPNPFNPRTTISFFNNEPQNIRVGVFDIKGRRIAELADHHYQAGEHSVEWQGRDSSGRAVPSGEYFFRVEIGDQVETRKAMLLR